MLDLNQESLNRLKDPNTHMTEVSIPKITREQIDELSYIKPVKKEDGGLFYLTETDPVSCSFTWTETTKRARNLKEIARVKTLHKYGYHGFFKPSLEEVYAQILKATSKDTLKKSVALQTIGPDTVHDFAKDKREFDAGYHVAETILYAHEEPEDNDIPFDYFRELSVEEKLDHIWGLFETPGDMKQHLHTMYFDNPGTKRRYYWEDPTIDSWETGVGTNVTVGWVGDMPVAITIWWDKINGKYVGFYESTSVVVHHDMIHKWIRKRYEGKMYDSSQGFLLPTLAKMIKEGKKPGSDDNRR